jgi:hypothetical protein
VPGVVDGVRGEEDLRGGGKGIKTRGGRREDLDVVGPLVRNKLEDLGVDPGSVIWEERIASGEDDIFHTQPDLQLRVVRKEKKGREGGGTLPHGDC